MNKFIIGCLAVLAITACNKDEKAAEDAAGVSQDAAVEVADDVTAVAADATEVVDAGSAVSPTEEVSTTK